MNVTLQPYVQPHMPSRLIDFLQPNQSIHGGNYTSQIITLSNSALHMVNESKKKFGNNSSEPKSNINNKKLRGKEITKRHIVSHNETGVKVNQNQARLGCLDHKDIRANLPESTVDVDIEYLDPKMVTRLNINDKNLDGLTPLMRIALTSDNSEDITSLIKQGAKVNLQDNRGNTALMWVVKSLFRLANEKRIQVKLKILDILINSNADLNIADIEGFTPLMIAVMGDDKKSFKKLFINKAMVELKNYDGQTALHLAVKYNASKNIIDQLSVFYQKMNVNDNNGHTPFMIASFYGKLDLMDSFFNKGVDVDHMDAKGWTALMHAVNCSKEEIVNKLYSYGAKINFTTPYHISALVIAFKNKDKVMALALIKAGAVTTNVEMKRWLKEVPNDNGVTNELTVQPIANHNIADIDNNIIPVSDDKDDTIVVKPISECDLYGEKTAESNSSKSGESLYSIPQWIVYKMRGLYEAFRRYASPIPPL